MKDWQLTGNKQDNWELQYAPNRPSWLKGIDPHCLEHIPVEIWEEISRYFNNAQVKNIAVDKDGVFFAAHERQIRNSGGRTYLVTTQTFKQGDK